jgi:diguanylate cyclase (GGDEF)-like protein
MTTPPKKILLIDDDPAMARLVARLVAEFRRGPFVVDYACDYAGGLACLLRGAHALCLLDYQLGARDGLELLREARAAACPTPVILLTGSGRAETDLAAMDLGAADFLEKAELTPRSLERAVGFALENAEAQAQLRAAAAHDELTGVLNRREFDRRLQEEWQRSQRHRRPFAVVMIDLDHFKRINDTHGHQAGDAVLRHVAGQLSGQTREGDCLARYGGDEFALLMVETDREGAHAAAARLHALLGSTPCRIPAKNLVIEVAVSVGAAAWPQDAETPAGLMAAADTALYAAKRQGRNRVQSAGSSL